MIALERMDTGLYSKKNLHVAITTRLWLDFASLKHVEDREENIDFRKQHSM